jgi:ElaA protein
MPLACARLVDPGVKYAEPSMGRVVTTAAGRGAGLGRELVARVLRLSSERFPGQGNRISAQSYLRGFYGSFGYQAVGEEYLEDGIPHIEMLVPAAPAAGQ